MNSYNLQRLVNLRRKLHSNPEIGFNEFQTQKQIKLFLLSLGIPQNLIRVIASTGLMIDLQGKGQKSNNPKIIAFRADIDALSVQQNNQNIDYCSKNFGKAHLCGHDGHTVWLLGFIMKFLDHIELIPNNITFRILFQPSQEGPESGAKKMIEEGCLVGVDEIYGIHNSSVKTNQRIWVQEGPIMSQATRIRLIIQRKPNQIISSSFMKDPLRQGVNFYREYNDFIQTLMKKGLRVISVLPLLKSSSKKYNQFSQICEIEGSIRSFQQGLSDIIYQKVIEIIKKIQQKGFQTNLQFKMFAPVNVNTIKQTKNVIRVAQNFLGKQSVGRTKLPRNGSQDFAYYTKIVPGAFFFISTAKTQNDPYIHSSSFDFNDDYIQLGAEFWWRLALDRAKTEN